MGIAFSSDTSTGTVSFTTTSTTIIFEILHLNGFSQPDKKLPCVISVIPFFRIFNPMAQGSKFDPKGDYVRRWIPEIGQLPSKYIHQPWLAPRMILEDAGIKLGLDYPRPIVDHKVARERALDSLASIKGA